MPGAQLRCQPKAERPDGAADAERPPAAAHANANRHVKRRPVDAAAAQGVLASLRLWSLGEFGAGQACTPGQRLACAQRAEQAGGLAPDGLVVGRAGDLLLVRRVPHHLLHPVAVARQRHERLVRLALHAAPAALAGAGRRRVRALRRRRGARTWPCGSTCQMQTALSQPAVASFLPLRFHASQFTCVQGLAACRGHECALVRQPAAWRTHPPLVADQLFGAVARESAVSRRRRPHLLI